MTKLAHPVKGLQKAIVEKETKTLHHRRGINRIKEDYKRRILRHAGGLPRLLEMAGVKREAHHVSRIIFNVGIFLNLCISAYLLYVFSTSFQVSALYVLVVMGTIWTLLFVIILFIIWLVFFVTVDLRILQRKASIEDILPEFLQLTAANVRAGMPIDRAMWFAMRPKFGVFAVEIERVAKSTYSGEEFNSALLAFSTKYNSPLLSRAVSLLIEGINAGGEIAGLLNRIAEDLTEVKLLKKDMAASVTMYIIFIGIATTVAAPILFALSTQLIGVITDLSASLGSTGAASAGASAGLGFSLSKVAIQENDFKIFSIGMLAVTSFFAACIVATIKKGSIASGYRYIPAFMFSSVAFYLLMHALLNVVFANIIVV